MKSFRCGDVVPGCHQELVGEDVADVLAQVDEHARRDHGVVPDEDLVRAVRERVRDE
ncbi:DUF1059 domain-containing protein [Kineococcus indalonis]|uniref:DUF1059 domain-containing protein n=1 Tax=Kineococcus indalonis TaxID=2696566 RepID=UPI0014125122|nr:DUF1059 domain-containing protein [Kineococcus indalonis]NAZ87690.1 DUF1059 domain-containing protein [Kineococcus indalonis]